MDLPAVEDQRVYYKNCYTALIYSLLIWFSFFFSPGVSFSLKPSAYIWLFKNVTSTCPLLPDWVFLYSSSIPISFKRFTCSSHSIHNIPQIISKQVYLNSKLDGNAVFCTLNHCFSKHSSYCKCLSRSVCTTGVFAVPLVKRNL